MNTWLKNLEQRLAAARKNLNANGKNRMQPGTACAGTGERGMTLIEIMVVIVIIGVLGSALAYGVFGMLGTAQEDTAKAQMATVGGVIEFHQQRNGDFPDSLQALTEGRSAKLKPSNLKDPWKKDLIYSTDSEGFSLCSSGPDRKPGTDDDVCYGGKEK